MIEFKGFCLQFPNIGTYLNNMGWIRIRKDLKFLPGSGTRKIQSWIRIRNKSFRIHNTAGKDPLTFTHYFVYLFKPHKLELLR